MEGSRALDLPCLTRRSIDCLLPVRHQPLNPAHGGEPWAGPRIALVSSHVSLDALRIMLLGQFSWAAVLYHARFQSMRVGANCFWKFRPA